MSPPATHAATTANVESRLRATMYGLMKMPAPMMPPTTTMVASQVESTRRKELIRSEEGVEAAHDSAHRGDAANGQQGARDVRLGAGSAVVLQREPLARRPEPD